jgi:hypothetical protein
MGAHTDLVEDYIKSSKWETTSRKSTSPFTKLEMIRSTSKSVGEELLVETIVVGYWMLIG